MKWPVPFCRVLCSGFYFYLDQIKKLTASHKLVIAKNKTSKSETPSILIPTKINTRFEVRRIT
ncbi:hypothetical protein NITGR_300005 [Nitrospina gracilis 3/211]|uniref:Uncharacterized protein n=1 Tax=Nitrospina gracilis (strain 3/211) TaxID=1266370 RepID=M1YYD4_NITG3|nr:hypothetical protein NITGR_300005 [Nitrospina gracilis 3/211]